MRVIVLLLGVLVSHLSAAEEPKRNLEAAKRTWETVIAAKGGRDRLHGIRTLGVRYEGTDKRFLSTASWYGRIAYELPNRVWGRGQDAPFRRDMPGLFSLRAMDAEAGVGWDLGSGSKNEPKQYGSKIVSALVANKVCEANELYLLETKWYQPKIVALSETTWRGRQVIVIYVASCNGSAAYLIDPHLRLPVGFVYLSGKKIEGMPPIPQQTGPSLGYAFQDYVSVDGVQLPSQTTLGHMTYEINREYPRSLFSTPPQLSDWGPWPAGRN